MAKLNRFTMPVFAGNAAQSQTSVFGTMKTSPQYTTDVAASIGTAAYGNGWADAIDLGYAPFMEDMNTLQRAITYQIAYNQQQGIPEWASDTTYYKDSLVKYNTGSGAQIYASLANNNVGNLLSDTTKWKLVLDTANSYVTINTAETITGAKTFTGQVNRQNSSITKGTAPASAATTTIEFTDKNGLALGHIYHTYGTDKTSTTVLQAMKANASGDNDYANIAVRYPPSGSPFTYCLTPTDTTSTSSHQIATVGWVNSVGNNVVHRSGNETIDGAKTFNESPNFKKYILSQTTEFNSGITAQKTDVTKGTAPANNYNNRVLLQSKDGTTVNQRLASLDLFYHTENMTSAVLSAFKPEFDSTTRAIIGVYYPATGNPYTYCTASDRDNSILTTVDSGTHWVELGNGWKIVKGRTKVTVSPSKTATTITFPTPFGFSSANSYSFAGTFETIDGTNTQFIDDTTFIVTEYKTNSVKGFGFDAGNNSYEAYMRWVAIGK